MSRSLDRLISLPRHWKIALLLAADAAALSLAAYLAVVLRTGQFSIEGAVAWIFIITAPVLGLPLLAVAGVYRAVIRFLSIDNLFAAIIATTAASALLSTLVFIPAIPLPGEAVVVFSLLAASVVCGSRLLVHFAVKSSDRRRRSCERVVIYGAGEAGRQLAVALARTGNLTPVAFVDDSPGLQGRSVLGLSVYGSDDLAALVVKLKVARVLLAIPSASRGRQREILGLLGGLPVQVQAMPGLDELAAGRRRIDDLREIGIEDLLGRDAVSPDPQLLGACIQGLSVAVTGAGGSIGSELCRQIVAVGPRRLILIESSEPALYAIDRELRSQLGKAAVDLVPVLASVQDEPRLRSIFEAYRIDTVYHAAAYKHVPLVEHNVLEGVRNNVFGTRHCAQAAIASGVKSFVLVSTDKAVRPTNVMGATKRVAELVLQALAREQACTRFCMVRFGNVLASSGSVVPLFRDQIRKGGPVTVTHPDVIRYFMTIPEAALLVIQAGSMGQGGDVFLLNMGEPMKIVDLAHRMINLSGLQVRSPDHPEGDIEIVFSGLRPGEKLYEELLITGSEQPTRHPMIMRAEESFLEWSELAPQLLALEEAALRRDVSLVRVLLLKLVEGYRPEPDIVDWVWRAESGVGVMNQQAVS